MTARRHFERAWGCVNLEVPASALNETEPFSWFACHMLDRLPAFQQVYNQCVEEYRRRHGHPQP